MKNFRLNNETLRNIQATTGMEPAVIANSDLPAMESRIERHIGARLKPAITVGGLSSRGSVYLMLDRLMTSSQVDKVLSRIK